MLGLSYSAIVSALTGGARAHANRRTREDYEAQGARVAFGLPKQGLQYLQAHLAQEIDYLWEGVRDCSFWYSGVQFLAHGGPPPFQG